MRLALSTLGCPELGVGDAASLATRHGFGALEIRSSPGKPVSTSATSAQRRGWRAELQAAGCKVLSVASYVRLCDEAVTDDDFVARGVEEARLAHDLEARWLRVFPGGPRGGTPGSDHDRLARRRLGRLLPAVADLGVQVAVETHDSHPGVADVRRIVEHPDCAEAAVIWDILHTWLAGETPTSSAEQLGNRLAYVQIKDVAAADDLAPLAPGRGRLPLAEMARGLHRRRYTGWVSWEYERAWYPEAPPVFDLACEVREWCATHLPAGRGRGEPIQHRLTGPGASTPGGRQCP